jgi:hypothetical protein
MLAQGKEGKLAENRPSGVLHSICYEVSFEQLRQGGIPIASVLRASRQVRAHLPWLPMQFTRYRHHWLRSTT